MILINQRAGARLQERSQPLSADNTKTGHHHQPPVAGGQHSKLNIFSLSQRMHWWVGFRGGFMIIQTDNFRSGDFILALTASN